MANSDKNLHIGHRQRMKQRFAEGGSDSFSDHELLEMLLYATRRQGNTNHIAHALLNEFHTIAGVLDASPEELLRVDGIGESSAFLISLLPHIMRRYQASIADRSARLTSIRDFAHYLKPYFFAAQTELVYLLSLDDTGRVLGCDCLSEGSANAAHIDARTLASNALRRKASAVVLSHCHPLGSPEPSPEDCATTEHCKAVLAALHIRLLDHLIFADERWMSMARMNMI